MSNEKSLTPEKLKTFKGLENLTDEQAAHLTEQLNIFARILIKMKPIKRDSANENKSE